MTPEWPAAGAGCRPVEFAPRTRPFDFPVGPRYAPTETVSGGEVSASRTRILVIEDDDDILDLMGKTLTDAGFDVVMAPGGREAVRAAREHSSDLVLTDLAMPWVGGPEVIRELRARPVPGRVPVIAVTAHGVGPLWEDALAAGCDALLCKPFSRADLLDVVYRVLARQPADGGRTET